MGIAKRLWMEQQEEQYAEERLQWIQEQLNDEEANENHPRWEELAAEFDNRDKDYYDYADDWNVPGKTRLELFDESIQAVLEILNIEVSDSATRNLYVMLYGHTVAAVEGFLSSTFISTTLTSNTYIQALVESDPEFANRKFTLKDFFAKQASLHNEIGTYLKEVIFHNVFKVKSMYMSVFNIDFGDVVWLSKAVLVRHDCVHRAGYDKEGLEVPITSRAIKDLVAQCKALVHTVDAQIHALPEVEKIEPTF